VPIALFAYARFAVDFKGRVALHLKGCQPCARLVGVLQLSPPKSEEEKRILKSLASDRVAVLAAVERSAKAN